MKFSFINDISKAQLTEEILWYLKNGVCYISHGLIHVEPVQLKLKSSTARTSPHQPLNLPRFFMAGSNHFPTTSYSDEDERISDDQMEGFSSQLDMGVPIQISQSVIRTNNTDTSVLPQLYEMQSIQSWFKSVGGEQIDPNARRPVSVERATDTLLVPFDQNNRLLKTANFIHKYLSALQQHIKEGNVAEVVCWLDIWQTLQKKYSDENYKLLQDENDLSSTLKIIDITLPNKKLITTHAHDSSQAELLGILEQKYKMIYKPSKYQAFCDYLKEVANAADISGEACDQLFAQHMGSYVTDNGGEPFYSSMIITDTSEEGKNLAANEHLNMYPLELACYEGNVAAVTQLARAGAKLTPLKSRKNNGLNQFFELFAGQQIQHQETQTHELIMAINADNLELFKALKDVYLQQDVTSLIYDVPHQIMHFDKPEFLECLIDYYGIEYKLAELLMQAQVHGAAYTTTWIMMRYDKYLSSVGADFFRFLQPIKINDDEFEKFVSILKNYLKYSPLSCVLVDSNISRRLPAHVQQQIYYAHNANGLCGRILQKRDEIAISGRITVLPLGLIGVIKQNIYMVLYQNYNKVQLLCQQGKQDQLIMMIASGNIAYNGFSKSAISKVIDLLGEGVVAPIQDANTNSVQVNLSQKRSRARLRSESL
jgi:hypothetical protein